MKFFFERIGFEYILSLLAILISLWLFVPVYDDYGAFLLNMASGQFSDFNFIDLHYMGFILLNNLYKLMYSYVDGYDWMGIFIMLFSILGLLLTLKTISCVIFKRTSNIYALRIVQVMFSIFYLENLIVLSHTRFSLILCGISLFNSLFNDNISKKQHLFYAFMFVIGMLHRPESSIGMFVLLFLGYVIYYGFRIKVFLRRIILPLAATISLFTVITADRLTTEIYINKIEPEIEYKMMDHRMVDISSMKTPVDSIKYELSQKGMWFDTTTFTPDYLRSLLLPGINLSFSHFKEVLFHTSSFYGYYLFVIVLSLSLLFFSCFYKDLYKTFFRLLLWNTATFAVIYLLDFNGLLVDGRHFLNIQIISLLVSLYYFHKGKPIEHHKSNALIICSFVLIISLVYTLFNYSKTNKMIEQSIVCYESFMTETEKLYKNKIVVLTLDNYNLLDQRFALKTTDYTQNKYIMYDMFTYSLIPEYVAYLDKVCKCKSSDPVVFFQWLSENNALYVAKPSRYNLTEVYMKLIYGVQLHFMEVNELAKMPCTESSFKNGFEIRQVIINNP